MVVTSSFAFLVKSPIPIIDTVKTFLRRIQIDFPWHVALLLLLEVRSLISSFSRNPFLKTQILHVVLWILN